MAFDLPYTFAYDTPTSTRLSSYSGLSAAVSEWMGRDGDADIDARFDDLLALHESRMYYGCEPVVEMGLPRCDALRIREMEFTDATFVLQATVAQPVDYLELISATLQQPGRSLEVVNEAFFDAYSSVSFSGVYKLAISGTNFRVKDDPQGATCTLRYYKRLTTPTPSAGNAILLQWPNLYLHGCLYEAAVYVGDVDAAKVYFGLYAAGVRAINARRYRELNSAQNIRIRVRGRTP